MENVNVVEGRSAMDTKDAVGEEGINLVHAEVLNKRQGVRRGKDEVAAERRAGRYLRGNRSEREGQTRARNERRGHKVQRRQGPEVTPGISQGQR